MNPYCIYVTYHSTGKFYVGKGVTACVLDGSYRGSGKILHDTFKKYPRAQWVTEIIEVFSTEQEAYAAEAKWVDEQLLQDPQCLNLVLGGHGWSSETVKKQNIERWQNDLAYREKMTALKRRHWLDENFASLMRQAAATSQKMRWQDPSYRDFMTAVSNRTVEKTWRDPNFQRSMAEKAWAKPETREKMIAGSIKSANDAMNKQKRVEGVRAQWQDPTFRAQHSQVRSERMKNIKWMTKNGVKRQIHRDQVDVFIANGWKLGMK